MRNIILGTIAGLLIGAAGALGYSQLAGDGNALADLQSKLNDVNAKLAKAQADEKFLKEQNNSESAQLDEVLKSKQAGATTDAGAAAAAPAGNPLTIGGTTITPDMIRGFMAMMGRGPGGGFRSPEQRAFLLQARLKLTPDQAKAIKDAMDADNKARRDAFRAARQNGGQVDPAALAAANSLDKTMASVLSPSQQVQYQQVQSDEKQARAESQATQQVDNMMPLLQLSDDQKSKLMNSLYQQQLSAPDMVGPGGPGGPGGFGGAPGGGNPLAALAQQGQAVSAAMKSVLSPDQYALYQQNEQVQQQTMANFGGGQNGGGRRNRQNGQNGGATDAGGGQAAAPVAGAADAGATSGTTTATGTSTTTGTTTATGTTTDSTSTTTPSATTNAASGTPPTN